MNRLSFGNRPDPPNRSEHQLACQPYRPTSKTKFSCCSKHFFQHEYCTTFVSLEALFSTRILPNICVARSTFVKMNIARYCPFPVSLKALSSTWILAITAHFWSSSHTAPSNTKNWPNLLKPHCAERHKGLTQSQATEQPAQRIGRISSRIVPSNTHTKLAESQAADAKWPRKSSSHMAPSYTKTGENFVFQLKVSVSYGNLRWSDCIMKGHNLCEWLKVGETENCGKCCIGVYCKVHLARIRRKSKTPVPCRSCGKGVQREIYLCQVCGRERIRYKHQALQKVAKFRFYQVMAELLGTRTPI